MAAAMSFESLDLSTLRAMCVALEPVGSRVTCNPPPADTDADYLVLVDSTNADRVREMIATDFQFDGSDVGDVALNTPDDQRFASYSDGEVNLIVTESVVFFRRFMAATSVAKRLNLMSKDDRVALFQAVLYGNR